MDVADRGIAQNDSRSILRRGTAEGYSEVDFVALTGEVFRSRWTVRRSRGKVDGSLQKVEMTLTNLTSGVEQQGTKTELLSHISKLIGLSFEQFNRSVLLALNIVSLQTCVILIKRINKLRHCTHTTPRTCSQLISFLVFRC